jgi:broad specificity polyphosphatase/5'/3'-nucleotidase SurE
VDCDSANKLTEEEPMAIKRVDDCYKLKLNGAGITVDRSVNELVARQIMDLVMSGAESGEGQSPKRGALGTSAGDIDSSTPKAFMRQAADNRYGTSDMSSLLPHTSQKY